MNARGSVHAAFAQTARAHQDRPAVSHGERTLTYRDVDALSDRVAAGLLAAGLKPGGYVALAGVRCLVSPAAILGVLKAGGVYVPIDPRAPYERMSGQLRRLGVRHAVELQEGATGTLQFDSIVPARVLDALDLRQGVPRADGVPVTRDGDDAAYVLFTSGSTGVPKAVAVPHRGVVRLVRDIDYVALSAHDRVAHAIALTFDLSVFEIFAALLNGGCLDIADSDTLTSPARAGAFYRERGITVTMLPTGLFHHLAGTAPAALAPVRSVLVCGDILSPAAVGAVFAHGGPRELINAYGPTENSAVSTAFRMTGPPPGGERIPIGTPISDDVAYVVRDDGELAAPGESGELWLGGRGVALGYVGDEERTRERFVPDRFSGTQGLLYRTGDRARWLPDGNLDFLGRRDRQVKIRDHRIELDEVELALASHPRVGAAAAVVEGTDTTTRSLVAYFTVRGSDTGTDAGPAPRRRELRRELRAHLERVLPSYMIPTRFLPVAELPLTAHGKLDRTRLEPPRSGATAAPEPTRLPGQAEPVGREQQVLGQEQPVPGREELVRTVLGVWETVFDRQGLTDEDDFFNLGGNSLLAATVMARLQPLAALEPADDRLLTRSLLTDGTAAAMTDTLERILGGRRHGPAQPQPQPIADLAAFTRLSAPIRTGAHPVPDWRDPRHIVLTGTTGFTGAYLLKELLARTDATVLCLVRAGSPEQALGRVRSAWRHYGLGSLPSDRLEWYPSDLAEPRLGLPQERIDQLTARADLIVHAAAFVNFTYPLDVLARTTVDGTRELVRWAGAGRGIPVHFVSSMATLTGFSGLSGAHVDESTPLSHFERLGMPYAQSKWLAEKLLQDASRQGLPVAVHRPYEIAGDLDRGAWNLENSTCGLLRAVVDMGEAPDIDLPMDFFPVDLLAKAIAHAALHHEARGQVYHLHNPRYGVLGDVVDRLRARGHRLIKVPFREWGRRARHWCLAHPSHPFVPFLPLWTERLDANGLTVKEMYFERNFPPVGDDNAVRLINDAGIELPPVDDRLIDHYLDFFERSGFLPRAGRHAATAGRPR